MPGALDPQDAPVMPHTAAPGPARPDLSVIIPARDEGGVIADTIRTLRDAAARRDEDWEVIVIDDGSVDATRDEVLALQSTGGGNAASTRSSASTEAHAFQLDPIRVRLLINPTHRGKGFSVRRGVQVARGNLVLPCDADLSVSVDQLDLLSARLDEGFDVVIASRDRPDSVLAPPQPPARRIAAAIFRYIRRRVVLPELRDTQCGFKLFRREAAAAVFRRVTLDGWMFDCEALVIARALGYRIAEVGVTWRDRPGSRVRPLRELIPTLAALPTIRRAARRVVEEKPS